MRTSLAVVGVLVAVFCVAFGCSGPLHTVPDTPTLHPATALPTPAPLPSVPAPAAAVVPTSIDVDSIGAHATDLQPLGVDVDGSPQVPDVHHPQRGGWLEVASDAPDKVSPFVILGHVDGDGQHGLFYRLTTIKIGSKITLGMSDGTSRFYHVTSLQEIKKSRFPASVYAPTINPEIRLITCGGPFDHVHANYLDSEIAFAVQDAQ